MPKEWKIDISAPHSQLVGAWENDGLVGGACLSPCTVEADNLRAQLATFVDLGMMDDSNLATGGKVANWIENRIIKIDMIATDPAWRGHGIARNVVDYCETIARQHQCEALIAAVANTVSHRVFDACGYLTCPPEVRLIPTRADSDGNFWTYPTLAQGGDIPLVIKELTRGEIFLTCSWHDWHPNQPSEVFPLS
ncbi:GNAT family N-acetyltransferase [Corynebacterium belfantii]|uniref:GNAT family N-acetyltransferase n=1 Tax=Corynebacterium belfantii TaxID=2014537 RepID=UPI0035A8DC2E